MATADLEFSINAGMKGIKETSFARSLDPVYSITITAKMRHSVNGQETQIFSPFLPVHFRQGMTQVVHFETDGDSRKRASKFHEGFVRRPVEELEGDDANAQERGVRGVQDGGEPGVGAGEALADGVARGLLPLPEGLEAALHRQRAHRLGLGCAGARVDQETHVRAGLEVGVLAGAASRDEIDGPAVLARDIAHEGAVGALFRGGGEDAEVLGAEQGFHGLEHGGAFHAGFDRPGSRNTLPGCLKGSRINNNSGIHPPCPSMVALKNKPFRGWRTGT